MSQNDPNQHPINRMLRENGIPVRSYPQAFIRNPLPSTFSELGQVQLNPQSIVSHQTAGAASENLANIYTRGEGGAHFTITKKGMIITANLSAIYAHVGEFHRLPHNTRKTFNNTISWGIEIVSNHKNGKWEPVTWQQQKSFDALVNVLNRHAGKVLPLAPHYKVAAKTYGEGGQAIRNFGSSGFTFKSFQAAAQNIRQQQPPRQQNGCSQGQYLDTRDPKFPICRNQ